MTTRLSSFVNSAAQWVVHTHHAHRSEPRLRLHSLRRGCLPLTDTWSLVCFASRPWYIGLVTSEYVGHTWRQREAALSERERAGRDYSCFFSRGQLKEQLRPIYLTLGVLCHNYASWVFNSFFTLEVKMMRCILVIIKALLKENPTYLWCRLTKVGAPVLCTAWCLLICNMVALHMCPS